MITKNIKQRMKDYFLQNPTVKTRIRQLERELKLPLPSIIRYIKELAEESIIKSEIFGGVKLYSANRSSKNFILEKKLYNLRMLYDSGLVEHIIKEYHNPPVVVFGSYAIGEDVEDSDIDLYLETSNEINLKKFEIKLKRKIQVFCYKNLKIISNKELANSIVNGIKLNGFLEVYK